MENHDHYDNLSDLIVDYINSEDHQFTLNLHYHNGYELFYFERADAQLLINHQIHSIRDGDLVLINPFVMHTAYRLFPGRYERYYINIATTEMDQAFHQMGLDKLLVPLLQKSCMQLNLNTSADLDRLRILHMNALYQKRPTLWRERFMGELVLLVTKMVQAQSANNSEQTGKPDPFSSRRIYRLLAYVDEHFRENQSLSDLEQHFFISRYHICRLFKKETGLTLSQYVNRKKISLAQQLLKDPDLTVNAVGQEVGFHSPQHFSQVFKTLTGMTPSDYRTSG